MELNFENLPLVRVTARCVFGKPIPLSVRLSIDLVHALGEKFTEVLELPALEAVPGAEQEFRILSKPVFPGFRLLDPEQNLALDFQDRMVSVVWTGPDLSGRSRYPRYNPALRQSLQDSMAALVDLLGLGTVQPTIVNMAYSNYLSSPSVAPSGVLDYLALPSSNLIETSNILQLFDIALHLTSGIDYRLTVQPSLEPQPLAPSATDPKLGFSVTTAAGKLLEDGQPFDVALDLVHQELIDKFALMLTDRAKKEWKLS